MRPIPSEETCPMSSFRIAVVFGALAIASAAAFAQTPGRVRGTITAIDGNMLSVKSREGQDLKIELAPNATFAYMKALKLSDIAPGTPLGTSAVKGPDGKIVARELHLFSKDRPIPNEGHRPWDLEPGSTMTNAMAVDGDRSLLVAGQYAYIAVMTDAGGKMTATRVQITKDGVKPPQ